jgi:hypothetical protein
MNINNVVTLSFVITIKSYTKLLKWPMYNVTRLDFVHTMFQNIELKYKTVAGEKLSVKN